MSRKNISEIKDLKIRAFTVPTDFPESDGTLQWDSTTIIIVEIFAGDKKGLGYSYSHKSAALLIEDKLKDLIIGKDAMDIESIWFTMLHELRNLGKCGISASAVSAIDIALWDLKAKLLNLSLAKLFGKVRDGIDIYGSGGFTSYSEQQLRDQLSGWVDEGIKMVKMKIGRVPEEDIGRVKTAREAVGENVKLFVDANGGYGIKQALSFADLFTKYDVTWFEEPVSSDNLEGLNFIKNNAPANMEITAGEYGYEQFYFERMLEAEAVDVLQADATRCLGFSGFKKVSELCNVRGIPLSAHTAPNLHVHICCSLIPVRHVEYFHDHVRIERMFFDGALKTEEGKLYPNLSAEGMGLKLKENDIKNYEINF